MEKKPAEPETVEDAGAETNANIIQNDINIVYNIVQGTLLAGAILYFGDGIMVEFEL